jgi:hypothetical protein
MRIVLAFTLTLLGALVLGLLWTAREHPPKDCIGIGKGMEERCWR